MNHSFLLEEGHWKLEGNWLEGSEILAVKGGTIVAWNQQNYFTLVTKLVFPQSERQEMVFQYRGLLGTRYTQYSYASLRHDLLGRVEGEGWIGPQSIIQKYWVLGESSPKRRSGFETFYRLDPDTYHLCSGILVGHYLSSILEATLSRQT